MPTEIGGVPVPPEQDGTIAYEAQPYLSQGCVPVGFMTRATITALNGDLLGADSGCRTAYRCLITSRSVSRAFRL